MADVAGAGAGSEASPRNGKDGGAPDSAAAPASQPAAQSEAAAPTDPAEHADGRSAAARARAGIHAWIARAGQSLLRATPYAILTALTAAALAPVLMPLLAGAAGSYVLQQLLAQLGNVGGEHVSDVLQDVVARLRREAKLTGVSEEAIQNVLERRLEEEMAGPDAAAVRAEITQILRAINGVGATLAAAYRSDVAGLGDYIGRAVGVLSETVTEFRALGDDMLHALASIQSDTTHILVAQQAHGDELRSVSLEIAMLRRDLALNRLAVRSHAIAEAEPGSPGTPGPDLRPYPGLAAFGETDARWFYGRKRLTATIVNRLRERLRGQSPLMVVGASGAGKSSVLRAGLIPELDTGGLAEPGSEHWPREIMTPGQFPLRDLAIRLARLAELPASTVIGDLADDPDRTPLIIRRALLTREERRRHGVDTITPDLAAERGTRLLTATRRLLLVIDQFEEVFTQCSDGGERKRFIDAICAAARGTRDSPPAALVVIGLRAGFVENCTAHPELEPALREQLIVGPMNRGELYDAIERPARDAGLTVEAGLAAAMLSDLGAVESPGNAHIATYDPGKLPLLAHALHETWERRDGGRLTIAAYHEAGGIKNAIGKTANDVYDTFGDRGKQVAMRLLSHMVSVRADAEDTRRRMSRAALLAELPTADAVAAAQVLDRLEEERLVTVDQETVQIAHEALLREWPLLRDLVEKNRASIRAQQRLTEQAREWDHGNRHPDRLLRGAQLSAVLERLSNAGRAELGDLGAAFLRASQRRQARAEWVRRTFVAVLIVLVVVAAGFAVVAQANSRTARQQQAIAQSRQLAAEADALRASAPGISLLLSLEAYRIATTNEAVSSLLAAQAGYFTTRLKSPAGPVNAIAYDQTAPVLASAGQDDEVTLWDTATRKPVSGLPGRSPFYAVAFDPAGRLVAGAEQDGTTVLWNARSHQRIGTIALDSDSVDAVAFSPDGRILATAGYDGKVALWRTDTLRIDRVLRVGDGTISGIAFSANGALLAAACADHDVRLWNLATSSARPRVLSGHTGLVRAVAFSPDSTLLASGSDDGTVRLWDPRTGASRGVLTAGTAKVRTVAFSPGGTQLASGGEDSVVRLWDMSTHAQTGALTGLASTASGVAFSPDGHTLASADADATVGIWNIAAPPQQGSADIAAVASALRPGGTLVTSGPHRRVNLWNPLRHSRLGTLFADTGPQGTGSTQDGHSLAASIALSSDGEILATPAAADAVALWRIANHRRIGTLTAPAPVTAVAYRPVTLRGAPAVVAAGSSNGDIYLWGPHTAQPVQISGQLGPVNAVTFSPDGTLLAAGSDDGTILLARVTITGGHLTATDLAQAAGHLGPVEAVAFSPDGRTLASGSTDDTVRLWDISNPSGIAALATLAGHTHTVVSVAFSSDGDTLASSADDDTIRLWDVRKLRAPSLLATLTGLASPTSVVFAAGRHTVVGGAADGTAMFWDTKADEVANRFCASQSADAATVLQPYLLGVTYHPVCPKPSR